MQHDVETAHHAGITSIAVLTGYNDAAQLSKAKPDMIVPDLLVLRTLMRRYALPSDTQDSININGLELDTFIGVPDEERASMQTLKADITFYPEEALSGLNDDFPEPSVMIPWPVRSGRRPWRARASWWKRWRRIWERFA